MASRWTGWSMSLQSGTKDGWADVLVVSDGCGGQGSTARSDRSLSRTRND